MKSEKKKLSDCVILIGGGTPKTSVPEYWNGDIPWLSVKDFNDDFRYVFNTEKKITKLGLENSSTKLLQKDDIIISARGTVGELAMIPFPMAFNQSCYGIRAKEGIDKTFLYYLLKYSLLKIKAITHGTVFDTITRATFDSILVDIPDYDVQVKIAEVLSSFDDKIMANFSLNNNLLELMETVYSRLVESKGPSWKTFPLSELVSVNRRGLSPKYVEKGIPVINQRCIRNKVVIDEVVQFHDPNIKYDEETLYQPYDVLINSMGVGTLGRISQIGHIKEQKLIHSCITVLRANKKYDQFILGAHMKYIQKEIENMGLGTTGQTSLNNKDLGRIVIPVPPKEIRNLYGDMFKTIIDKITNNLDETRLLTEQKNILLKAIMSGKLDVSDLELEV